jgi:hypothetical protein
VGTFRYERAKITGKLKIFFVCDKLMTLTQSKVNITLYAVTNKTNDKSVPAHAMKGVTT